VTGGVLKIARRICEVGVAGSPVIGRQRGGAFSTLLRQCGLRASTDGVLATKSERKMLASTCLYSLYAWFILSFFERIMTVVIIIMMMMMIMIIITIIIIFIIIYY